MGDGAHLGVKPTDALKTILGGEPEDTTKRQSPEEFAAWIRSAPEKLKIESYDDTTYDLSCRIMARCFLTLLETQPAAKLWTMAEMFDRAEEEFPDVHDAFDGVSGFMVGWAFNAANKCVGIGPVPNPAIIELEVD